MKALAIILAILFAWISGAGTDPNEERQHLNIGAIVFLFLAIAFGYVAWRL